MESCYTVESIRAQAQTAQPPKYLFFWGHTPDPSGAITKACFSQWWPAPFEINNITYRTAEHYMMAQKALLFDDRPSFQKVLAAQHPRDAKQAGRGVANFDETLWRTERFRLVVEGNLAKFSQHVALGDFLLKTGDRVLVEASPVDTIWGIGLAATDPACEDPQQWKGLNLLGFALMTVRDLLREPASPVT